MGFDSFRTIAAVVCILAVVPAISCQGPATQGSPSSGGPAATDHGAATTPFTGEKFTLAVAPFRVLGDVKAKDAGQIIPERLLPHFAERYTLVDLAQLERYVELDKLEMAGLMAAAEGKDESARQTFLKNASHGVQLRAVRYLVGGTVSVLPRSAMSVRASITDWQKGEVIRTAEIEGEDWDDVLGKLRGLADQLQDRATAKTPDKPATPAAVGETIGVRFTHPAGANVVLDGQKYRISEKGVLLNLAKGAHRFELREGGQEVLFGVVNVLVVDSFTKAVVFGDQANSVMLKATHVQAARQGRPVFYNIQMTTAAGTRNVIECRLSLRPIE